MIFKLFARKPAAQTVERLYGEIVAAARRPQLYLEDYAAPDTVDGRFDLFILHAFLVLRRLMALPAPAPDMAQDLSDRMFLGFDRALREMGVGDLIVPKRMHKLADANAGRSAAYEKALASKGLELDIALARNVYGSADPAVAARLARYVRAIEAAFADKPFAVFEKGPAPFPDPAGIK
jgi:cytochrome b pre-mRNA-processing protein 3